MADSDHSIIKLLRPRDVWHPKVGAPFGNRNRARPNSITALRRRIRGLRKRLKLLRERAGL